MNFKFHLSLRSVLAVTLLHNLFHNALFRNSKCQHIEISKGWVNSKELRDKKESHKNGQERTNSVEKPSREAENKTLNSYDNEFTLTSLFSILSP